MFITTEKPGEKIKLGSWQPIEFIPIPDKAIGKPEKKKNKL